MTGLSMSQRPMLAQRQYQRLEQRQKINYLCLLCKQTIPSDESRAPWNIQMIRAERKSDCFDPCLECGQRVPDPSDKKYIARVSERVKALREAKKAKDEHRKKLEADQDWPKETISFVGEFFAGWCPGCRAEMHSNIHDLYECTSCRMQIRVGRGAHIMPKKGMGDFRTRDGKRISAVDELPGIGGLDITEDLRG